MDTAFLETPWKMTQPRLGEQLRWESANGRWIALSPGYGVSAGSILALDSGGRCEAAPTFEEALATARRWRTEIGL